jgi:hypothetical protein
MKLTKKEAEVIILLAQKIIIALDKKNNKERNIELQNKDYNLVCEACDD